MVVEGVAWGISVAGWIMSPIISKLLNKFLSHCKSDKAKTLHRLLTDILPRLKLTLEAAESIEHRIFFEEMVTGLKAAFYDMECILDELEYIRHQKKLDSQKESSPKRGNKNAKLASDTEPDPSNQDICDESSFTLPGNLNGRLKDNMDKIEQLIHNAHGVIALAKPSSKGETDTGKNTHTLTTSAPTVKVTGRDDDRDGISKMLRDVNPRSSNNKCFSVIGIHGISGSGKTTLAQHVCEYEKSQEYFNLVVWIQVTQNYSVRDIFKEMLEAASSEDEDEIEDPIPAYSSVDVLQGKLKEKIKGKRFLLVLDDIWCNKDAVTKQLPKLLSPLMDGEIGSRILATSRDKGAFSDLGPDVARDVFAIRDLDGEVFLDLFMYYALEDPNADDPDGAELRSIGAEIAHKLKGSPLAASTVGGQLRESNNDVQFWRELADRDLLNETMGALWWSYQHLDEQVRRCFAYCSIFPKRRRLNQDELVKLWVAEGFIQTANAEDMEAVGRGYFQKLVATSFVKPGGEYQGSDFYVVHDLMHDLAEKVAGRDCFRIENGLRTEVPPDVRHLFVANAAMVTENIFKLKNLSTLIIDDTGRLDTERLDRKTLTQLFEKVFKNLQKLRVLSVEIKDGVMHYHDLKIPETIDHLKYHLRYLGLVIPEAQLDLPKTLAGLYHLQVLMFGYSSFVEVEDGTNMGNLTNLRHIIGGLTVSAPYISRLTSLQTFEQFGVKKRHGYELKQLRDLNKLRGSLMISLEGVESKEEAVQAKLADKKGLTELSLTWDNDMACTPKVQAEVLEALCPPKYLESLQIEGYQSLRYPRWMVSEEKGGPKYLKKLQLNFCKQLGPAPELFKLFTNLRELDIANCNWDHLPANLKDLRWLEILNITNCWYLKLLPELPRSLQKFELVGDDDVLKSCTLEGHSNFQNLQHVGDKIFKLSPIHKNGRVRKN